MIKPLVSICLPCFNAGKFIIETLQSLTSQDYPNIEILVIDDNSTDNSWQLLNDFARNNSMVYVEKAQKKGAAAARNQAFNLSKGDYVIFFDADDIIQPNFVESQMSKIVDDPASVVVSCWGRFYGAITEYTEDPDIIKKDLSFKDWIVYYWTFYKHTTPPGRVLIARKVVLSAGLWDENLSLNDDFEFFTRIFSKSTMIKYNDDALFYYRSGIGGLSSKFTNDALNSYYSSLELSFKNVLALYPNDKKVAHACANLWQIFVYSVYPNRMDLTSAAKNQIYNLGGAAIDFPAGGITKVLTKLFGWKIIKRIKHLINRNAIS
jgi:glycosyltransferase involved in cell wall biosynthesis